MTATASGSARFMWLFRACAVVLAAALPLSVFVAQAAAYGVIGCAAWQWWHTRRQPQPAGFYPLLSACGFVLAASMVSAAQSPSGWQACSNGLWHLWPLCLPCAFLLMPAQVQQDRWRWLYVYALALVPSLLLGVWQFFTGTDWLRDTATNPLAPNLLLSGFRPRGALGSVMQFAGSITLGGLTLLALSLHARERPLRHRMSAGLIGLACVGVVVLTLSRSYAAALVLGTLGLWMARSWRAAAVAWSGVIAIVMGAALTVGPDLATKYFGREVPGVRTDLVVRVRPHESHYGTVLEYYTSDLRLSIWTQAVELVGQRPVLGYGPGLGWIHALESRRPQIANGFYGRPTSNEAAFEETTRNCHNAYLQIVGEGGAVGLWAAGLWALAALRAVWRRRTDEAGQGLIHAALAGWAALAVVGLVEPTLTVLLLRMTWVWLLGVAITAPPRPAPAPSAPLPPASAPENTAP